MKKNKLSRGFVIEAIVNVIITFIANVLMIVGAIMTTLSIVEAVEFNVAILILLGIMVGVIVLFIFWRRRNNESVD